MQEAVSAILDDRAKEAAGLSRMLMLSLAAHVAIVAAFVLVPGDWRSRTSPDAAVMTISLGGAEGPDTGGMTTMTDRAVQSIAKPDAPKALDTPPATKAPEMVEPDKLTKPAAKPRTIAKPQDKSTGRTPTAGAEIKAGAANVRTGGAAIPFGGLAQGGGGAGGVRLDVQNFCCPEYLALMVQKIKQNWNANQGATGQPEIKFTIRRDGVLTNVELEKSSGQALLDLEARRAVHKTAQLPPLPKEFPGTSLTVHLSFDFQR
jgi:periplasmic protein TonB